jgi:gluconolactonase
MHTKLIVICQLVSLISFSQTSSLDSVKQVKPGATLMQVSKQFSFTEGPAADKKGNIYFTDQPNDKIWKYDTEGNLSLFMEKTGRSNGMYFDQKGRLISCADEKMEIWAISPEKKVTVLIDNFQGKKLNGPNDLWVNKKGGIYFTDPYYQRSWWERKKPDLEKQNLYFLPAGKKEAVIADSNLVQPNGIIGSSDGKTLFVSDIRDNKIYKYQIGKDGSLSNRQLFISEGSDGMVLDNEGNLYTTGRTGVNIYNPSGVKMGNIPVPSRWTANVCFGGKDFRTLFITASESVYTLQMQVKGAR